MKTTLALLAIMLLWSATPAFAHRLDEYLQATTFAVEQNHVTVRMRLTPGVQVFPKVLADIDTNGDGAISQPEQQAYADQVRRDVSLTIDTHVAPLRLLSSTFPTLDDMKQGLGDIVLTFQANLPDGGPHRTLIFQNHHLSAISVYLANCLVSTDPGIHITAQDRNYDQSFYQLDYTQSVAPSQFPSRSS